MPATQLIYSFHDSLLRALEDTKPRDLVYDNSGRLGVKSKERVLNSILKTLNAKNTRYMEERENK